MCGLNTSANVIDLFGFLSKQTCLWTTRILMYSYETLVGTIAKKFSSGKSQSDSRMDDVRQQRQGSRKRKGQSGAADAEQPPRKFRKPAD